MIIQAANPEVSINLYCEVCRREVEAPTRYDSEKLPYLTASELVDTWFDHQNSSECIPYDQQGTQQSETTGEAEEPNSGA